MDISRPIISAITDEPVVIPVYNDSGGARAEGDVVCWQIGANRKNVETPASGNQYKPAGVVTASGISASSSGYIYRGGGRPVDAKVLGEAGLTAGDPLEVTAGQVYLSKVASPVTGVRYHFVAAETYETAEVALKAVYVDCEF